MTKAQERKLLKRNLFNSSKECSRFSKHLSFLSIHKHHMIQWGIIFHIATIWILPKSITLPGITHAPSVWLKISSPRNLAISQCNNRGSPIFLFFLHNKHNLYWLDLVLKLSMARTFPRDAVQQRKQSWEVLYISKYSSRESGCHDNSKGPDKRIALRIFYSHLESKSSCPPQHYQKS